MDTRKVLPIATAMAAVFSMACGDPSGPDNPLVITTDSLPATTIGEPYSEAVNASGGEGDYDWDVVSGTLPAGLVLRGAELAADGALITGTPTQQGPGTFTIEVRSEDGQRARKEFTIQVNRQLILNVALPPALVGATYSVPLRATGGDGETFAWEVLEGQFPAGLMLEGDRVEGTPSATDTATVTLGVTSGGQSARRTFDLHVVAHRTDSYDITPLYIKDLPAGIQSHLDAAFSRWEAVIAGDLGAVSLAGVESGFCGGFSQEADGTATDDILIIINIDSIDGPGDVLGQAGPCLIRNSNLLPLLGILTLDSGDLTPLIGTSTLTDVIAHEIGHVLGFGSIWHLFELTENAGTDSTRFVGDQAIAEFQTLGGSGPVPLESEGGPGTADGHWRETVFGSELMTGFVSQVGRSNPLSRVSIASFADMGYQVDLAAADPFSLPQNLRMDRPAAMAALFLGGDILDEPVRVADDRPTSAPDSPR